MRNFPNIVRQAAENGAHGMYLPIADLLAVADGIDQLVEIANQGALTELDPPQAGWGVSEAAAAVGEAFDAAAQVLDLAEQAGIHVEALPLCGDPYCDEVREPAGENVWRCARGHLTIKATPGA